MQCDLLEPTGRRNVIQPELQTSHNPTLIAADRGEAGAAGHTDHVGRPQAVRTRSTGRDSATVAALLHNNFHECSVPE
ncbi:hypothetical protein MUK42_20157 [Musa troglodytarum]|uniref:Uncharacterized protein n=1 Tax=Musa troglodytarum TaxID=320322 RepID=A0A9E7FPK4_9LILI|nr:hypothetical protein MUK42_21426 [Musa troglodytarum]URE07164.1 hypothetical protein MUK42_20157 [Musa troglodytarum]